MQILREIPTMGHPDPEYGRRGNHAEVVFDDCRVPTDHLIGARGGGFLLAQQRLGGGRDGNPDDEVAALAHQSRQSLALRAGDKHERIGGRLQVAEVERPIGGQANNKHAAICERAEGTRQIRRPRDGHPRRRTGRRLPRGGGHSGRPPLGYQHAIATERGHRSHDGAKVARIGDAVERHNQRHSGGKSAVEHVVRVQVIECRDLQDQTLMHRAGRVFVELMTIGVEQRDVTVLRQFHGLADPLVDIHASGDVQRRRRRARAQHLHDRIATHHDFRAAVGTSGARRPLSGPLICRRTTRCTRSRPGCRFRAARGRMPLARLGGWRRPAAF